MNKNVAHRLKILLRLEICFLTNRARKGIETKIQLIKIKIQNRVSFIGLLKA